jgi:cyclin-dependent kinase 7
MGTPTEQIWPNVTLLPNYIEFESREPLNLATLFPNYDENCESNKISSLLQLVSEMLMLDPLKRLSATQCLEHRFFTTTPPPCPTETFARSSWSVRTSPANTRGEHLPSFFTTSSTWFCQKK